MEELPSERASRLMKSALTPFLALALLVFFLSTILVSLIRAPSGIPSVHYPNADHQVASLPALSTSVESSLRMDKALATPRATAPA